MPSECKKISLARRNNSLITLCQSAVKIRKELKIN